MEKQVISCSSAPEVIIEQVAGNLEVVGWEQAEIAIYANPEELILKESEDGARLSCLGDCEIRLPVKTELQVQAVQGDARLKSLKDSLHIGQVHGSLYIKGAGDVTLEAIYGDLWVRQLSGDLRIKQVFGSASIRSIQGRCSLDQVMGDADLREIEDELSVSAEGDLRVHLTLVGGQQYRLHCTGDLRLRLPFESSARFNLVSGGSIKIRTPEQYQVLDQTSTQFTLGSGQAQFDMQAGGSLLLLCEVAGSSAGEEFPSAPGPDFDRQIAEQIEAQIKAQVEEMTAQMQERLTQLAAQISQAGLSPEQSERIMERARQASERANERAQEKLRRAQEKLERKLEAARMREEARTQERGRRSWTFGWPPPPVAPRPPVPPRPPAAPQPPQATEEERLMILRMLEQKKITLEEAEKLLEALEGN